MQTPGISYKSLEDAAGLESQKPGKGGSEEARLRHACQQFEKMMTKMLMKNTLASSSSLGAEDKGGSMGGATQRYKDMAYEQIGSYLGDRGVLGLGDILYEELKQRGDTDQTHNQGGMSDGNRNERK